MQTVADLRRANLDLLSREAGSLDEVAARAECSPVYLSQIRNRAPDAKTGRRREMGTSLARRLEAAFDKAQGWMDQYHPEAGERPRTYGVALDLSEPIAETEALKSPTAPVIGTLEMNSGNEFLLRAGPDGHPIGTVSALAVVGDVFAVRVLGDHLYPAVRHGACLLVDPGAPCEAGEMVLIEMHGGAYIVAELVAHRHDSLTIAPVQGGQRITYATTEVARLLAIVSVVAGNQFRARS